MLMEGGGGGGRLHGAHGGSQSGCRWGGRLQGAAPGSGACLCGCREGRCSVLEAGGSALPGRRREGRARTVKMLERRLDCLRMGVGVEEAAMVSTRSSRWLMLGVEGTEAE